MSKEEKNTNNQSDTGSDSSHKDTGTNLNIRPLTLVPHQRGFFALPRILRRLAK